MKPSTEHPIAKITMRATLTHPAAPSTVARWRPDGT
jgi:hypothetical protein